MTDLIDIKTRLPTRAGLSSHAIFRLLKTALKEKRSWTGRSQVYTSR